MFTYNTRNVFTRITHFHSHSAQVLFLKFYLHTLISLKPSSSLPTNRNVLSCQRLSKNNFFLLTQEKLFLLIFKAKNCDMNRNPLNYPSFFFCSSKLLCRSSSRQALKGRHFWHSFVFMCKFVELTMFLKRFCVEMGWNCETRQVF